MNEITFGCNVTEIFVQKNFYNFVQLFLSKFIGNSNEMEGRFGKLNSAFLDTIIVSHKIDEKNIFFHRFDFRFLLLRFDHN